MLMVNSKITKKRIQKYSEDPNVGLEKVENFLDYLHTIRFQTQRYELPRKSKEQIRKQCNTSYICFLFIMLTLRTYQKEFNATLILNLNLGMMKLCIL